MSRAKLGWRRDFTLLWVGQAASQLGSRAFGVAYLLWAVAATGSPVQAGLAGTVMLGASLTARIPAGWLADHVDRRRLMMVCDLASASASLSLALAASLGRYSLAHLLLAGVVLGIGWGTRSTAEATSLPQVVAADELPAAAAMNEARSHAAGLAGPLVGAQLFAFAPGLPFLVDGLSYLVALTCTGLVRTPLVPPPVAPAERRHPVRDIGDGLRAFWQQPFVRTTALLSAVNEFVLSAMALVIIIQLQEAGSPAAATGLVLAMGGAGALAGALVSARIPSHARAHVLLAAVPATGAVAVLAMQWSASVWASGVAFGGLFGVMAVWDSFLAARWLAVTDERVRGRVFSAATLVAVTPAVAAPVATGAVLGALGLRTTCMALAALLGIVVVLATTSRSLREPAAVPTMVLASS